MTAETLAYAIRFGEAANDPKKAVEMIKDFALEFEVTELVPDALIAGYRAGWNDCKEFNGDEAKAQFEIKPTI